MSDARPPRTPIQQAIGLLARREHSQRELKRKLAQRGVGEAESDAVLDRLSSEGWQDEARFAAERVRARMASGYGPLWIRAELAQHRIDGELIAQVMADAQADWVALAVDVLHRRFTAAQHFDQTLRLRAQALLMRRGFDGECIRAALRQVD